MRHSPLFKTLAAALFMAGVACLIGQDWQNAATLPGVDLNTMTPARKQTALKILRTNDCPCGCSMKLAECRVKDPNCSYSRGLSGLVAEKIQLGKTEAETLAEVKASPLSKAPAPPKILEDPVSIQTAGSPVTGPQAARVTLVEFSDFQCPYCLQAKQRLGDILKAYPTQVKLIFKQFPLDIHSQAALAAAAALAAHHQGKFWQLHDAIFADRDHLSRQTILAMATAVGLDIPKFTADWDSPETRKAVQKDVTDGERAGVTATPTVFVDGQKYNGMITLEALKPIIDAELKKPARK